MHDELRRRKARYRASVERAYGAVLEPLRARLERATDEAQRSAIERQIRHVRNALRMELRDIADCTF